MPGGGPGGGPGVFRFLPTADPVDPAAQTEAPSLIGLVVAVASPSLITGGITAAPSRVGLVIAVRTLTLVAGAIVAHPTQAALVVVARSPGAILGPIVAHPTAAGLVISARTPTLATAGFPQTATPGALALVIAFSRNYPIHEPLRRGFRPIGGSPSQAW